MGPSLFSAQKSHYFLIINITYVDKVKHAQGCEYNEQTGKNHVLRGLGVPIPRQQQQILMCPRGFTLK